MRRHFYPIAALAGIPRAVSRTGRKGFGYTTSGTAAGRS
jgi:hypothetical protein